jgi:hypothetical protein
MEYAIRVSKGIVQQLQPNLEGLRGRFLLRLEDDAYIELKIIQRPQFNLQNLMVFLFLNNILHQLDEWINAENVSFGAHIHGFLVASQKSKTEGEIHELCEAQKRSCD